MPAVKSRSGVSSVGAFIVGVGILLTPRAAVAQYTMQVLTVPSDLPPGTDTLAFAMNNSAQVFGAAYVSNADVRPVLWTAGVPQYVPLPSPYVWPDNPGRFSGMQFLNESGTFVAEVEDPSQTIYDRRVAVWQRNAQGEIALTQILPSSNMPSPPAGCSYDYAIPLGLNNHGHVLFFTGCNLFGDLLWIWDGTSDSPSSFQQVALPGGYPFRQGATSQCSLLYTMLYDKSHLNDADHIALDLGPLGGASIIPFCPPPVPPLPAAGIIADGVFTPEISPAEINSGAIAVNNHDQLVVGQGFGGQSLALKYWDGTTVVNLTNVGIDAAVNDLGEVLFSSEDSYHYYVARIYRPAIDTVPLPVPLPQQIPGFFFEPNFGVPPDIGSINSAGQLVFRLYFHVGDPSAALTAGAVVFTPTPPTIDWPAPADIAYGTPLGASQLNAMASDATTGDPVAGTFVYTPPAGTILNVGDNQTLSVDFMPTPLGYANVHASVTINVTRAATTTGLTSSLNPSNAGQAITLTATVSVSPPGQGAPSGTVQFFDGLTLLGSSAVTAAGGNATAAFITSALSSGTHSLTATYDGDANFVGSTSDVLSQIVNAPAPTTTTSLKTSANPAAPGQSITLTATVAAISGTVRPSGQVTFFDGGTAMGTASLVLSKGKMNATLTTPSLTVGTHLLTAMYLGSTTFSSSVSLPVAETIYSGITPVATTTSLTSSANPASVGQAITFTATVKGSKKSAPTGTVQFFADGNIIGSVSLTAGRSASTAQLSGVQLSAGTHTVYGLYVGDSTSAASVSAPLSQVVQ